MSYNLLEETRSWLAPLNEKILNHPYIVEVEGGTLPVERVKAFITHQYYTVSHDVRSLALMVSRSTDSEEFRFFNSVLEGDKTALPLLVRMAGELGLSSRSLECFNPIPEALVYAHYLAALAQTHSPGEQAMALIVNLPVWGSNCERLSTALRGRYGVEDTSFLDLFSQPSSELEKQALPIIERYKDEREELRRVARLIQAYELMFWNGIHQG